jgi:hypothetical protein
MTAYRVSPRHQVSLNGTVYPAGAPIDLTGERATSWLAWGWITTVENSEPDEAPDTPPAKPRKSAHRRTRPSPEKPPGDAA